MHERYRIGHRALRRPILIFHNNKDHWIDKMSSHQRGLDKAKVHVPIMPAAVALTIAKWIEPDSPRQEASTGLRGRNRG